MQCTWARQHLSILCGRVVSSQSTEILSITVDSGRTEKLGSLDGIRAVQGVSADDRTIFTWSVNGATQGVFAWEVGKLEETRAVPPAVKSDDGHWIFGIGLVEGRREIRLRHADPDDEYRRLVLTRIEPVQTPLRVPTPVRFTPDSKWIVYHEKDVDGRDAFYRVSVLGGEPERLGEYPTSDPSFLSISPDGRQVLVSWARPPKQEFWVIENVIPKAPPAAVRPTVKAPAR